jgi:hypothetical protein
MGSKVAAIDAARKEAKVCLVLPRLFVLVVLKKELTGKET